MRLPPFLEELRQPHFRQRLLAGVWSGYLIALALAVLATGAVVFDLVPYGQAFVAILTAKLITNTAALISLRRGSRFALEWMSLNTAADILGMTAAIYFTGGVASPLFAIYVIEIAVVALLSNLGTTLLVAGFTLAAYGAMCGLELAGVLPNTPPLATSALTGWRVAVALIYAAFAIGVPTLYTSLILAKLRQRETDLEARGAELIEAGKQKSIFLASVTHELRTPIHGISGLAELIGAGVYGPVTDKQRGAASSIQHSAHGLLHMIDDLLALVRAEVDKVEVRPTRFVLDELVEQVVASVTWMLGTKRLTLHHQAAAVEVQLDRRLVSHVLVNLVANAAKFTPEGGRVEVRAAVHDGAVTLAVVDTGIGIAAEARELIFEAFRQIDGGDQRSYGGMGLGLTLVKRLTAAMGGTVTVDSEPGRGSTFTVRLPSGGAGDGVELAGHG